MKSYDMYGCKSSICNNDLQNVGLYMRCEMLILLTFGDQADLTNESSVSLRVEPRELSTRTEQRSRLKVSWKTSSTHLPSFAFRQVKPTEKWWVDSQQALLNLCISRIIVELSDLFDFAPGTHFILLGNIISSFNKIITCCYRGVRHFQCNWHLFGWQLTYVLEHYFTLIYMFRKRVLGFCFKEYQRPHVNHYLWDMSTDFSLHLRGARETWSWSLSFRTWCPCWLLWFWNVCSGQSSKWQYLPVDVFRGISSPDHVHSFCIYECPPINKIKYIFTP